MATIKAIEDRSVHQITSGQVIVDLCSVVKELVENSLDAGATSVDVRFKNYGLDSVEVQDNGKGIAQEDFDTIALKHYTSKLSNYDDLTLLETFGFRGEALSSLCALSKFHIVTAQGSDGPKGKKLEFEVSGKLKGTSVVAAQRGTTVAVENLFNNLPVRRRELEKNIKREYGKVLSILQAYACICTGVKLSVSNQMPKGKKVVVFSTKSNPTTKENITNVFGAKTLLALVELKLNLDMQPSKGHGTQSGKIWSSQDDSSSTQVQVVGHISRPAFGEGRQAPDRQMFFVNSRPCGLPQVAKAINEVYKSFNVTQSPFVFANLIMDTQAYDVNVSPDKRTILLHDQTALLDLLKLSLSRLFESHDYSVPQSQLAHRKPPAYTPLVVTRQTSGATGLMKHPSATIVDGDDFTSTGSPPEPSIRNSDLPINLIHDWVGRDADPRDEVYARKAKIDRPSRDKQKLTKSFQTKMTRPCTVNGQTSAESQDAAQSDSEASSEHSTNTAATMDYTGAHGTMWSADNDLLSQPCPPISRPVQDFNVAFVGQQNLHQSGEPPSDDKREQDDASISAPQVSGEAISAVATQAERSMFGPVHDAFHHKRPKRTPAETATIVIGDMTTTTLIGSPSSKKRSFHESKKLQSVARFGASPLLAKSLREFAAPGTRMDPVGSEEEAQHTSAIHNSSASADGKEHLEGPSDADTEALDLGVKDCDFDSPESSPLMLGDEDDSDDDYIDEAEKKLQEDARVAQMIQDAEGAAVQPTGFNVKRAIHVFKGGGARKGSTLQLVKTLDTSLDRIEKQFVQITHGLSTSGDRQQHYTHDAPIKEKLDDADAEARLSLVITKSDFTRMRIAGQFNLGFILAVRPGTYTDGRSDEIFIIDQHAADEKYNFERLQRTTVVQDQRLVHPRQLELTAVDEEIIISHAEALSVNGFVIEVDTTGTTPTGLRCKLLSLPMSKEVTFKLSDLEELLHLLAESPTASTSASGQHVPRPTKIRRMLAMRACRSSIMVGKALSQARMERVLRHMGEMEKPWNCPHGRPTMRHLVALGAWDSWSERASSGQTDWKRWLDHKKKRLPVGAVTGMPEEALEKG
ncbi:ATP-binding mismatch repair protein [Elasticomyces elasticus]|nr:ATP-binding mismatch repair protein [Elasticomyces elasticus]